MYVPNYLNIKNFRQIKLPGGLSPAKWYTESMIYSVVFKLDEAAGKWGKMALNIFRNSRGVIKHLVAKLCDFFYNCMRACWQLVQIQ